MIIYNIVFNTKDLYGSLLEAVNSDTLHNETKCEKLSNVASPQQKLLLCPWECTRFFLFSPFRKSVPINKTEKNKNFPPPSCWTEILGIEVIHSALR